MRQLFFKIYLAVLLSLLIFAAASAVLWGELRAQRDDEYLGRQQEVAAQLIQNTLPSASSSVADQQAALERIAHDLNVNIAIDDAQGERIARVGGRLPPFHPNEPDEFSNRHGKNNRSAAPITRMRLNDGRVVTVRLLPPEDDGWAKWWAFAIGLLGLLLVVGLVAWPLSRRLTRRLEALHGSVTQWGKGDLSARAHVAGHDEVSMLASSFNQAAGRIEQLIQTNHLLLANASHELRTPLARMRMQLELLHIDEGDEKQRKRKQAIVKEIDEFDQMIDSILLGSRLDAQERLMHVEAVDMLGLVAEECAHYDGVSVEGAVGTVQGDAHLLRRLVRNLVENALRHGRAPVQVHVAFKDSAMHLDVMDAGDGFAGVDTERIFEPFYRGQANSNSKGVGLGLSLVYKIVQHHGGSVAIMPAEQGGHVQVILPCVHAAKSMVA